MLPTPHDPTPGADPSPRQHPTQARRALPWLAGVVALAAIIASCTLVVGRGGPAGHPVPSSAITPYIPAHDQVLHVAWLGTHENQISALDPATASDTQTLPIVSLLYDGLVTLDARLNPELWGADHVNISADGLTYTFHLRGGQFFSDGVPVHASDYVFSLTRALDPCFQSPVYYKLSVIAGAPAFSDPGNCVDGQARTPLTSIQGNDSAGTVTITLGQPAGYFLAALARPLGHVVERSAITGEELGKDDTWLAGIVADAAHPTGQGGSGMYYVAQYDRQGNLILKRNPNWWGHAGSKKPILQEIDYTIFTDAQQAEAAINASPNQYRYDVFDPGIPRIVAGGALGDPHTVPYLAISTVTFNWQTPPFDNADARQALCLAVNRDALLATQPGLDYTPTWHLVPQGTPGYNPHLTGMAGVTATAGDAAKARAHWRAYLATLGGKPVPKITYFYGWSTQERTLAEALARQWNAALGADTIVAEPYLFTEHGRYPMEPQVAQGGWEADYPDAQDFLALPFGAFAPDNRRHVSVPDAERLMQQAESQRDPAARLALYQQAEQLDVEQAAACPLFQYTKSYRAQPYIHGYTEDALGEVPLDAWVGMSIASH